MYEFRITKYDPDLRDERGRFLREDWTSFSDIGRYFSGKQLSSETYQTVERAYIDSVAHFLEEAKIQFLEVRDVENHGRAEDVPQEGDLIKHERISAIIGAMLREKFWCRLESTEAFVHIGYDYYMYLGVPCECPRSINFAHQHGLFVERFISPHHPEIEG